MPTLRPCPSCARHVEARSTRCLFCDAELALDPRPHVLPGRVYRATRFVAFAAAAALACGGTESPTDASSDQAADAPGDASAQKDGTTMDATNDTGASDSGRDAVEEDSGIALPYGAPPYDGPKRRVV